MFTACFQMRPNQSRFEYVPSSLVSWLSHVIHIMNGWNETAHYYEFFKLYLFAHRNESDLSPDEKQLIQTMDLIDTASRDPQRSHPLGLKAHHFFASPRVLNLACEFFKVSMDRVLRDQKLDILRNFAKYQHLNLSTTFFEIGDAEIGKLKQEIKRTLDFREGVLSQYISKVIDDLWQYVVRDNTTSEDMAQTSWILHRLRELDRQWGMIKETLDVAVIIGDWMDIPELIPFDIHFTKVGEWNVQEWDFFCKVVAGHQLDITRYKVSRWNPKKEAAVKKQGKSKKKSVPSTRRNRPNVLFNKYEINEFSDSSLNAEKELES